MGTVLALYVSLTTTQVSIIYIISHVTLSSFVAVAQGQLTLQALPDVLFVDNGGVHGVELGTVVRARCTASSSSSAPLLTWFKDGGILASDPPHIRIRSTSSGSEVSSVLTVDNFDSGDNGDYYCEASNDTDTLTSTTLSLSGQCGKVLEGHVMDGVFHCSC